MHKKDIRDKGRIILAYGEVTGHCHEVVAVATGLPPTMAEAQFFEVDGRRELIVLAPTVLQHGTPGQPLTADHDPIYLWPDGSAEKRDRRTGAVIQARVPGAPVPVRQGDVYLQPVGPGVWTHLQQREQYAPDAWRQVAD